MILIVNKAKCFLMVAIFLQSCSSDNRNSQTQQTHSDNSIKMIKSIEPDYFKLPLAAIDLMSDTNYGCYFVDSSGAKLFIVPYTDNSITTAILTAKEDLPEGYEKLLTSEGVHFDKPGIAIDFLETRNQVHLGMRKSNFYKIFNRSDSTQSKYNVLTEELGETNYWHFKMKETAADTLGLYRPFVHNGLGYDVLGRFRNDSLIHLEYTYEVP